MGKENFTITNYRDSPCKDEELKALLQHTFVDEGYTDPSLAEELFDPREVRKRGEIFLARSSSHELLGMVVCVVMPNPACRVAKPDEVEVQLFAVLPKVRGQGIASSLIKATEEHARSLGFTKMVLSTQPAMKAAHKVYQRHGYNRNPSRDWQRNTTAFLVYEKLLNKADHSKR